MELADIFSEDLISWLSKYSCWNGSTKLTLDSYKMCINKAVHRKVRKQSSEAVFSSTHDVSCLSMGAITN